MSDEPAAGDAPAVLAGQVAIVTGGGRGIGRAIVQALAQAGAAVVAAARTPAELDETVALVAAAGGTARAQVTDVTDRAGVEALVRQTADAFGRIDVLVNNAGTCGAPAPVWETDPDLWLRDLTTNLFGMFLCARAVLPHMLARRRGTVINLSGGGAGDPGPFYSAYACSKAGVLRFTDSLAAEVAPHGIRVFALGPGFVRTATTEALVGHPDAPKYVPQYVNMMAQGRDVSPELAGRLAVFLATLRDPRLSGRSFSARSDYAAQAADVEAIARDDLLTLRVRR
jgi:2-deoxy-D-gluconate 3-dehydrogenase